eukprot:56507-Alexandrium_andersonii.AAC.1
MGEDEDKPGRGASEGRRRHRGERGGKAAPPQGLTTKVAQIIDAGGNGDTGFRAVCASLMLQRQRRLP